ncbi:MAG: hypothetical protein GY943_34275 [Chloroflexi bacterium]|nr:hypothetical protein [Chloroflexota bacterium]
MTNNYVSRTATITLNDSPDKILPLFTAYGETLWITGWNPEYVYPEDGEAKTGSVWKTQHDKNAPETVWVTINYDTETHSVTYVNITPNKQVSRIDIQCDALDESKTSAQITYTITALGEKGTDYIKQLTQAHYDHWMQHSWKKAINHYLQIGEASSL